MKMLELRDPRMDLGPVPDNNEVNSGVLWLKNLLHIDSMSGTSERGKWRLLYFVLRK